MSSSADRLLELGPHLTQIRLGGRELGGRLVELGLLGVELLLDRRLLGADRGLLADELVDLRVLGLDRAATSPCWALISPISVVASWSWSTA